MKSELRTKASVKAGIVSDEKVGGVRLVEYDPGNGKKYVVSVSDVSQHPNKALALSRSGRAVIVWIRDWDCGWSTQIGSSPYPNQPPIPVNWSLVQSRLSCSVFDAVVLAELLGYLLNRPAVSVDEFLQARRAS